MADAEVQKAEENGRHLRTPQQKSKLNDLIAKQLDPADPTPLNPYELKNYIYFGFSEQDLRPKYWKVLLNHYSKNQFKTEQFYRNSRQTYHEMTRNQMDGSEKILKTGQLIDCDLNRMQAFQDGSPLREYQAPIKRMLMLYTLTNPNIGYVQGMISLILPVYHVLAQSKDLEDSKFAEEDAFFMFNNLMAEVGDSFAEQCDNMPNGLASRIESVFSIIEKKDGVLYSAMVSKGLMDVGVPLRWVALLFSAEFKLDSVIWLWDRILSDSYRFEILNYCCASAIVLLRNIILKEDFDKCMNVFQHISVVDVEVMFDIADVMRREERNIVELIEDKLNEHE